MANPGDAVHYRAISGDVYDAVLTSEPRMDSQRGGVCVGVEIALPGVREPVSMRRVESSGSSGSRRASSSASRGRRRRSMAKRNGDLKIETWPIGKVLPYAQNARLHSEAQILAVSKSIAEFGFVNPCLVDAGGVLIAGHCRVLASKLLGMKAVPVIRLGHLTELQARALRLADNALPEQATWSAPLLKIELNELAHLGYDMPLLGFEEYQLVQFMAAPPDPAAEIAPEPPVNPVTRAGDCWILGGAKGHRILCGDATSESDVAKCLAGAKPVLCVTDAPYGVDYDPDWRNRADRANGKPYGASAIGQVQNDDRIDWRAAYALFPGDVVYAWHADRHARDASESLEASGFVIRCQIIWAKPRFVISRGDYHWQHEPCWYAVRKGKGGRWSGDRSQTTLWAIEHQKSETGHGTQKPIECMKRPILNNSRQGEAVYDPFVGSGTTIIAAEITKRRALTLDIDPVYVDVAVERWAKFSGKEPRLESTGQTFAEVQEARYDGNADFAGSIKDGFAAVRQRVAAGAPGWKRGAGKPQRKGRPHAASPSPAKGKPADQAAK